MHSHRDDHVQATPRLHPTGVHCGAAQQQHSSSTARIAISHARPTPGPTVTWVQLPNTMPLSLQLMGSRPRMHHSLMAQRLSRDLP